MDEGSNPHLICKDACTKASLNFLESRLVSLGYFSASSTLDTKRMVSKQPLSWSLLTAGFNSKHHFRTPTASDMLGLVMVWRSEIMGPLLMGCFLLATMA